MIEVVLAIAVGLIIIAAVTVGYTYAKRAAIMDNQKKDNQNSVVVTPHDLKPTNPQPVIHAQPVATTTKTISDYKNSTYIIEGKSVTLVNGRAEAVATSGSSSKTVTQYFGNVAIGDLNSDGLPDVAFILTQNSGGSGTFYYVVAALKTSKGYQGTNGILLGDRIAPQTTQIKGGHLIVNYADRIASEPMSSKPTVGITKTFNIRGSTLIEAQTTANAGEHCGGNMTTARMCSTGYHCVPMPGSNLPFGDVGGICAAN